MIKPSLLAATALFFSFDEIFLKSTDLSQDDQSLMLNYLDLLKDAYLSGKTTGDVA